MAVSQAVGRLEERGPVAARSVSEVPEEVETDDRGEGRGRAAGAVEHVIAEGQLSDGLGGAEDGGQDALREPVAVGGQDEAVTEELVGPEVAALEREVGVALLVAEEAWASVRCSKTSAHLRGCTDWGVS